MSEAETALRADPGRWAEYAAERDAWLTGTPMGSDAGFVRPAIVLTADAFLRYRPTTVFAVPLTSTPRSFPSHVEIAPDAGNGLNVSSCALVEQLRAVATQRCSTPLGNVGPVASHRIVDILAMITGMP